MGWKSRVREIAKRNSEAVPPELRAEISGLQSRSWLIILKNTIRNAMIGTALVAMVFCGMLILADSYDQPTEKVLYGLGIVSLVFVAVFCLLDQNIVEDGVISVFVLIMGCMLVYEMPFPVCLIPGCGAIVGSIVKGTIWTTVGRNF